MDNDKTIQEISCKLIKRRCIKKEKIELVTIDSNAKCKIAVLSDGRIANDGVLETSKPVDLYQKETIRIEYELEFKKPIVQEQDILKIPIAIIQSSLVEGKTIAQFIFASVLENM